MASLTRNYDQKKLLGQVYTPPVIVQKILNEAGINDENFPGKSILDPACGDGRFLVEVVRRIVQYSANSNLEKNLSYVYGWDIDQKALDLCRINLNKEIENLDVTIDWNLFKKDALHELESDSKFDFIIGNPPYIRIQHLLVRQRNFLQEKYSFCKSGSTDTYIAFFELAAKLLSSNGVCGFITPNSYFFSETARVLRRYFEEKQNLIVITNFGSIRVFENTGTYSAITVFGNCNREAFRYELSDSDFAYSGREITFKELGENDLWQLDASSPQSSNGERLGDICQISVGITTLSDKLYLFSIQEIISDEIAKVRSKAGTLATIERSLLKPIIKGSRLKNSEEPISEYILFPYLKNSEGKHEIIPEKNMKSDYPFAYAYLLSQKSGLDKRDNGRPNTVAWYAFGRAQSLDKSFGKKIVFSPMNKQPKFILYENESATIYSGYFIKYKGDYHRLLTQLNSEKMANYMAIAGRDFRGGWKGYSKKIVENFRVDINNL
ncbi:HsdM family class I SAM-dependent methyltransferase [Persicitalea jodogahamensis]|uniref:site-specific DNA-methyltransferase (adenine-specific) n=1 Tax=Persicitalea jodogahamensis TaxID=402147 RepID=A0A8J3D6B4_9BACT|nr:N-6 DNA methylase [Persicitalea jodogahamensis]GHB80966.1 DNA methyltransferase [Persicitalea jodogahamensis]